MNTVIKQDLFRHRAASSAALNNLCTVIHTLSADGRYTGEVGQGGRVLGRFRLRCDANETATQANVDLSTFDEVFRINAPRLSHETDLVVGKDGYVVFSTSAHHQDLWVTLTRIDADKRTLEFDSRRLGAGDLLAFRVWFPGTYTLTNEIGGTRASLGVLAGEAAVARKLSRVEPHTVALSARGFAPSSIEVASTQALVIRVETAAAVTLTPQKLDQPPDARERATARP